jgi:uncharacterized membrane protein
LSQPDPWNTQLFAARLRPHRSLSQQNFRVLLMVFCGACFVTSLPFVLLGAWPVAGFMGLDALVFWLAFRANFRAARAYEDVSLTPLELTVAKVSSKGERSEWRWSPLWVRLIRQEDEDYGVQRIALVSREREVEIGGFLGPDAKAEFAAGLSRALAEARQGPRFS